MTIQQELQAIYDDTGLLTPTIVLDRARDPEHPLHRRFDWDDSEAAEKWRVHQAGQLIRSVKVNIERSPTDVVQVRAFVAKAELGLEDDATGEYLPVDTVIHSDVMRTAWFRQLEKEWKSLKRRAGDSQEFADMVLSDLRDETA